MNLFASLFPKTAKRGSQPAKGQRIVQRPKVAAVQTALAVAPAPNPSLNAELAIEKPSVHLKVVKTDVQREKKGNPKGLKTQSIRAFLETEGFTIDLAPEMSDREMISELMRNASEVPEEERSLLRSIASFYGMEFIEDTEGVMIDERLLQEMGAGCAKDRECIPVAGGKLLTSNPFVQPYNGLKTVLSTSTNIHKLLRSSTTCAVDDGEDPHAVLMDLLERAVLQESSDIHIEPRLGGTIVRTRIDGILKLTAQFNKGLEFHERLINKIFELSNIEASQFSFLHDSSFSIQVLHKQIYVRVSVVPVPPQASGFIQDNSAQSAVVLRLLYSRSKGVTPLDELGYDNESIETIKRLIKLPYGIILMAGPTGSGKTTALYSMMDIKRQEPIKVLAVEDPVEYPLDGITQIEVNKERKITFANAIRSFLRHDPDVILVGEVRDGETAEESLRASYTGHLVMATIHANTAVETIPRLLNLGISIDQLLASLKGCIAQRLVRKLCPLCREHAADPAGPLGLSTEEFQRQYGDIFDGTGFYVPKGCNACDNTGYKGRTVLWEILLLNQKVREHIMEHNGYIDTAKAMELCEQKGMRERAIDMIRQGITTIDEVERFIPLSKTVEAMV